MFELNADKIMLSVAMIIPIPGDMLLDTLHYYGFINLLAY